METAEMGRVTTEATIENLEDLFAAHRGLLSDEQVRRVVVAEALVDPTALILSLPPTVIRRLGLREVSRGNGGARVTHEAVRLTLSGPSCTQDVREAPVGDPVRIGRSPLLQLDLTIDPRNQGLIGNPAHGGEHIIEV